MKYLVEEAPEKRNGPHFRLESVQLDGIHNLLIKKVLTLNGKI